VNQVIVARSISNFSFFPCSSFLIRQRNSGNFLMFQHLATFDLRQSFFDLADKPLVVTHQTLDCFMHQRFSVASRFSIFLCPTVPRTGGKSQVSTAGGTFPVCARDGRELFYLNGNKIMSASITTHPSFGVSKPRFLADALALLPGRFTNAAYDISPDGQRFLFVRTKEHNAPGEVCVVLSRASV